MSTNYSCNQFDKAYKPTRLGNWEVPKWHINRPKGRHTCTKVIANDRGHLLPGVQKTDQKHWAGLYLGTYQLPKRISKEIAIELSNPKCQTWMKRSYHHPFIDHCQQNKKENNELENININGQCKKNKEIDRNSIKSVNLDRPAIMDVPITKTVRNCVSADGLLNSTITNNNDDRRIEKITDGGERVRGGKEEKRRRDKDDNLEFVKMPSSPALSRISARSGNCHNGNDDVWTTVEKPRPSGRRYGDAHKHHELPDAIEDAVYRSLQTKRHKHPGLGLDGCWPKCSAVAYKSFNDPGPTQCSKLRVYRPKTSSSEHGEKKESVRRRGNADDDINTRPKTCVPVMTAQQLTDIKLALCWDLDAPFDRNRSSRPPDEPSVFHKVQQHQLQQRQSYGGVAGYDGERKPQNSSAVMGFVKASSAAGNGENDIVPESRRTQTRECFLKNRNLSAVMELISNKDCDDGRGRPTETVTEPNDNITIIANQTLSNKDSSISSAVCSKKSVSDDNHSELNDCNNNDDKPTDEHEIFVNDKSGNNVNVGSIGFDENRSQRRRQSSAEFSSNHRRQRQDIAVTEKDFENSHQQKHIRPCLACDNPNVITVNNKKDFDECSHYKMAFKAGVPVSTPVKNRTTAASKPAKHLKVPKPKTTNSDKKKYVIGTLLPPFSMWPGTTARDYPEHWRLTSVYRQAFKPLELRKQPFLQTIYL